MIGKRVALSGLALVIVIGIAVLFAVTTPNRGPAPGPHSSVSTSRGEGPLLKCSGIKIKPGSPIGAAVANAPPGTTFCLSPGTFMVDSPIDAKSGDTFIGTAPRRDGVTVKTNSSQILFDLADTIGVRFDHFAITGAINACPGDNCGETGRAISRGSSVAVIDMHLYGNGRSAIGGTDAGLAVRNSEIDHNGAELADGVSAGIKAVHPFSVKNSFIHDNINNGIWCDIQCGRFVAQGNLVTRNTGNGIFVEISQGPALIADNVIRDNNSALSGTAGGISITDSRNVVVRGNELSGNHNFGIAARMDQRVNCGTPTNLCGYLLAKAVIRGNRLTGNTVVGCEIPGVICKDNV